MSGFPKNPEDGMLFSPNKDLLYQYSVSSKSWIRIDGVGNIGPATISKPGLMSAEDFKKIQDILVPPIQTTITADECETVFNDGLLKLISSNDDLRINTEVQVYKPDGIKEEKEFIIHNNTLGIDFRVNVDRLIEELENRNKIKYLSVQGNQGPQGDRGPPGIDYLDTGPIGLPGTDGANAPFAGSLEEDTNEVKQGDFTTAVVDVRNDEENPKKIIVKIGYVGNPNACPNRVKWRKKNSPWLLCLSKPSFNCNNIEACRVCDSTILYINIEPILQKIAERYEQIMLSIKTEKELLLRSWLDKLIEVFNAQKQAVCCALESVSSKDKNQEIRDIWSNSRYQAAQAGYAFDVTDDVEKEQPRNIPQQVPADFWPIDTSTPDHNVIFNGDPEEPVINYDCSNCYVQVEMNKTNVGQGRSIKFDLPAGGYVATIVDCCMMYNGIGSTGVFNLWYNHLDFGGDDETSSNSELDIVSRRHIKLYDRGFYPSSQANDIYSSNALSFNHNGGEIEIYPDNLSCLGITGKILLCIQPWHCLQGSCLANEIISGLPCNEEFVVKGFGRKALVFKVGEDSGDISINYNLNTITDKIKVYYPPVKNDDNLLGETPDDTVGSGTLVISYIHDSNIGENILVDVESENDDSLFRYTVSCPVVTGASSGGLAPVSSNINISHIEFYERGWRSGNCCGAYVSVLSSKFLVVFKSIGVDCSCGGGEYVDTPFISTFKELLNEHVAIAWPTIDGETFFGLMRGSSSSVEFIYDEEISRLIIEQINSSPIKIVGDISKIKRVIVPVVT